MVQLLRDISNYFNEKIDIKPSNINLHSSIKKLESMTLMLSCMLKWVAILSLT